MIVMQGVATEPSRTNLLAAGVLEELVLGQREALRGGRVLAKFPVLPAYNWLAQVSAARSSYLQRVDCRPQCSASGGQCHPLR